MRKYSKLLVLLLVLSMILPGFAQVVDAAPVTQEVKLERLAGTDRVQTAIKISQKAYLKADTVVLAGYNGEADALTGTLLAEEKNAPVLLTYKNMLHTDLVTEMNRLGAKNVYILGGETVVFPAVETALKTAGFNTTRLKGDTRVETAIAIANEVFGSSTPAEAFAVDYNSLADALAIGPVAANKKAPILITYKDSVPVKTKEAMKAMNVKDLTVIGKELAVSEKGLKALQEITGKVVARVGGANRESTSLEIANKYFKDPKAIVVANGYRYADALVGGYFAANLNAPIVLTNTNKITLEVLEFIKKAHVDTYVLGGLTAVSADVYAKIAEQLKVTPVDPVDPPVIIPPVDPVDPQVQIIAEAKKAVEVFESKVATAEKVLELVANDDLRNQVSASFTDAFNKVQKVNDKKIKDELLDRLNKAQDIVIAATSVKGLQNSTKNLTEENLENAKIKLSNAKTTVRFLPAGEIKDALTALIEAEEYKIVKGNQDEVDAAVKAAQDAINALPSPEKITKENLKEVKAQIAEARRLLALAQAMDSNVVFNLYPLEQAEAAVANFVTVTLDLDGGTVKEGAVTEFVVKKGEKLELPHPIILQLKKEGYTFTGWMNTTTEVVVTTYDREVTVTEDVTYKAVWKKTEGTVMIDLYSVKPSQSPVEAINLIDKDGNKYAFKNKSFGTKFSSWETTNKLLAGVYTLEFLGLKDNSLVNLKGYPLNLGINRGESIVTPTTGGKDTVFKAEFKFIDDKPTVSSKIDVTIVEEVEDPAEIASNLLDQAELATTIADANKLINDAYKEIKKLPAGEVKTALTKRMNDLSTMVAMWSIHESYITTELANSVRLATTAKRAQSLVDGAQARIDEIKGGYDKTALQAIVDAQQVIVNAMLEKENAAIAAVVKAEESKLQADVDAAKGLVEALPNSKDKTALLNRLNAVQKAIDDASKKATVTLDLDGGTVKEGAVTEFVVAKGEKLEIPHRVTLQLKKEGYTFTGWENTTTGEALPSSREITVTEDVTYKAVWEESKGTVMLDLYSVKPGESPIDAINLIDENGNKYGFKYKSFGAKFSSWETNSKLPAGVYTLEFLGLKNNSLVTLKGYPLNLGINRGESIVTPTTGGKDTVFKAEFKFIDDKPTVSSKIDVTIEEVENPALVAAIKAAEEAIAALPLLVDIKIENKQAVLDAKALVEAVKALDPQAAVKGEELITPLLDKITDLEEQQKNSKVTLDLNGGKVAEGKEVEFVVKKGSEFNLPHRVTIGLERDGYTFKGWVDQNTGINLGTSAIKVTINQDTIFKAKWEASEGKVNIEVYSDTSWLKIPSKITLIDESGKRYEMSSNSYGQGVRKWETKNYKVKNGNYKIEFEGLEENSMITIEGSDSTESTSYVNPASGNEKDEYNLTVKFADNKPSTFTKIKMTIVVTEDPAAILEREAREAVDAVEAKLIAAQTLA